MGPPSTGRGVVISGRSLAVAAVGVLVVAVAAAMLINRGWAHAGGDPGGRMLAELRPVATAVPPGVQIISREDHEASWADCGGAPGSGWTSPEVAVHFSTSMPSDQLVERVDQQLTREGWRFDDAGSSSRSAPPGAPEGIWRKRLAGGSPARAVLHSSDQPHDWWLYANALPLGAMFPDNS